jgi:hypothetical protein
MECHWERVTGRELGVWGMQRLGLKEIKGKTKRRLAKMRSGKS